MKVEITKQITLKDVLLNFSEITQMYKFFNKIRVKNLNEKKNIKNIKNILVKVKHILYNKIFN